MYLTWVMRYYWQLGKKHIFVTGCFWFFCSPMNCSFYPGIIACDKTSPVLNEKKIIQGYQSDKHINSIQFILDSPWELWLHIVLMKYGVKYGIHPTPQKKHSNLVRSKDKFGANLSNNLTKYEVFRFQPIGALKLRRMTSELKIQVPY